MSEIDKFVGARIRLYRKSQGLSQTDLGNRIGVRFQQVQKYESGANRVAASRLWKIADTLGVNIQALFQDVSGEKNKTERSLELLNLFRDLPPAQQDEVITLARLLAVSHSTGSKNAEKHAQA